jgi:formamidopyrimidine-DNA glycosylase
MILECRECGTAIVADDVEGGKAEMFCYECDKWTVWE